MNIQVVRAGLRELKRSFRGILDDSAGYVIDEAIAGLESSKQRYDDRTRQTHDPRLTPEPWGYRIYPARPLRFKKPSAAIRGLLCWVDVYCTVLWREMGSLPVEQVLHVRIWSDKLDHVYRPVWDSKEVLSRLSSGRVMHRCHFDRANPEQLGPRYHLQFGGNAQTDELCWFPEVINLPRFPCPPMDLILVCQLIAASFYWDQYGELRNTREWIGTLRRSQQHLLHGYYEDCVKALKGGRVLLDHLWNI